MPIIPHLFDNGEIVTDYKWKAENFNNYFASQCTPLDNFDLVPEVPLRTQLNLSSIEILNIIKALDPNISSGKDKVSLRMIKIMSGVPHKEQYSVLFYSLCL